MTLLFDIPPVSAGIGVFAGVAFFFVLIAVAFIVFKMLKRTMKMAFRIAIVGIILAIAAIGAIAIFALGYGGFGRGSGQPPKRPAVVQPK